jgi:hypothetical protein
MYMRDDLLLECQFVVSTLPPSLSSVTELFSFCLMVLKVNHMEQQYGRSLSYMAS